MAYDSEALQKIYAQTESLPSAARFLLGSFVTILTTSGFFYQRHKRLNGQSKTTSDKTPYKSR